MWSLLFWRGDAGVRTDPYTVYYLPYTIWADMVEVGCVDRWSWCGERVLVATRASGLILGRTKLSEGLSFWPHLSAD